MFTIWYCMAIGFIIFGAINGAEFRYLVYGIAFGSLGAIDMLVCNIVIRLKKKSEFEEWTIKFNEEMKRLSNYE